MDAEKAAEGLKKFLEGWASHRNELAKTWKKFWMVLRGNFIFLFTAEKANKENMVGTLSLGSGTYVSDIKSKKGFKFELTTLNHKRETTKNVFKFSKEDDFHLWRAYILAIATGIIPNDVQLLPGQRLDIYEAIVEVNRHNAPTSGPAHRRSSCPGGPTTTETRRPSEPNNMISHNRLERLGNVEDDEDTQNDPLLRHIQQLEKRREDIAKRDIGGINLTSSTTTLSSFGSPIVEIGLPFVSPPPEQKSTPHSQQTTRSLPGQGPSGQRPSSGSQGQKSTSLSPRSPFLSSPHPFYSETTGNNKSEDTPSWFVNCSRGQAEEILTSTKKLGTVLMRANSRFPVTGNYVISFRRELEGKVVVSHYNIIRSTEGFKIDVENQHDAMPCLSSVMEFFLSVAGTTASPLTSNDLTQLLGKYQAKAFPSISSGSSDVPVEMRSQASTSRKPRQRIDAVGSPNPTPPGSNRSSSVQSSSGSTGSRASRVSFDFSSRRPSDPHHGYTRPSSTASSGVFCAGGGGSVSSAPGPQRSVFSSSPYSPGSLQDSVYSEAVPVSPDRINCIEHAASPGLSGSMSVPNNLEVYSNQQEMTPTGSSYTVGTLTSSTGSSGTGAQTRTDRQGFQTPSNSGSPTSLGSYGFGLHMNHGSSQSTYGSGPSQSTYEYGSSQGTYGPGTLKSTCVSEVSSIRGFPPQSTYGSDTQRTRASNFQRSLSSESQSTLSTKGYEHKVGTPGQSKAKTPPPPPLKPSIQESTYEYGSSQGTYGPGTLKSTCVSEVSSIRGFPPQSTYGSDTQRTRASNFQRSLSSESQGTLSTKGYEHKVGTPGPLKAKTPPPPPLKPSSQEIYIMMKPIRQTEADYGCRPETVDDAYGQSAVEEYNGAQKSVKDLARMLQCAVTSGK